MKFLLPFLAFSFLFFVSCQDAATTEQPSAQIEEAVDNSNHILFGNLYMRFMDEDNSVKAQAFFKEGPSLKEAKFKSFPGGVSFQGSDMQKKNLQGKMIRYETNGYTNYIPPFRFGFDAENKGKEVFTIDMPGLSKFSIDQKGTQLTITTENEPLQKNETLVLLFTDRENTAASVVVSGPTTSNTHQVSLDEVKQLKGGKCSLYLVKKRIDRIKTDKKDIKTEVEYYTESLEFILKK